MTAEDKLIRILSELELIVGNGEEKTGKSRLKHIDQYNRKMFLLCQQACRKA